MENQNQPGNFYPPQEALQIQRSARFQPPQQGESLLEDEEGYEDEYEDDDESDDDFSSEPDSGHIAQMTSLIFFPIMLLLSILIIGVPIAIGVSLKLDNASLLGNVLVVGMIVGEVLQILACFFFMSLLASSRSGKISTSLLASLWIGIWFFLLGCILYPIFAYIFRGLQDPYTDALLRDLTPYFISLFVFIAILLFLGICVCPLAGLLGRYLYKSKRERAFAQQNSNSQ